MEGDPDFVKDIETKAANGDETCKSAALCIQAMRGPIVSKLVTPSPVAYLSAAVATLQTHATQKNASVSTSSGLLLVLRRAMQATSAFAVCACFNNLVLAIGAVLKHSDEDVLVKQALSCLLEAAQAAYNANSRPNKKVLKPVFSYLAVQKTDVRRKSEIVATAILKKAVAANDEQTLESATQHLCQMIAEGRTSKKTEVEIPAQHALIVLRAVGNMPVPNLTQVFDELLKMPGRIGQHPVCIEAFYFVKDYFDKKLDETEVGAEALNAHRELATKALSGLLAVPVAMLNVNYVSSYANVLASVVAVLSHEQVEPTLLSRQRLAASKKLIGFLKESDPTILRGAKRACETVFTAMGAGGHLSLLEELPDLCIPLLGYETKGAFRRVLPVVTSVLKGIAVIRAERVGPAELAQWTDARFARSRELVERLVATRDKARGGELNWFGEELSEALGAAVAAFGAERVLQIAELRIVETPLNDISFEQNSRSWMLLILRDHSKHTSLSYYSSCFLSIASALKTRFMESERSGQAIVAKKYWTLIEHVWALLPGFCDEPVDLHSALMSQGGKMAKQLVNVLLEEPSLRQYVWAAFSKACEGTREPSSRIARDTQESNRACLQTLSGRVMPEMFNAFLRYHAEADNEGHDQQRIGSEKRIALAAVQKLTQVAEGQMIGGLFKKLVAQLLQIAFGEGSENTGDKTKALPLAELSAALIPHLEIEFLEIALKVFSPMLNGCADASEEDRTTVNAVQKTAYRAVLAVIEHPKVQASVGGDDGAKIVTLWSTFQGAKETCSPSALKARIASLESLLRFTVQHLSPRFREQGVRQEFMQFLTTVMPEVLSHLRDRSTPVRDAAREFLSVAATTAIHQELQTEIVTLISGGLAGLTPESKNSTVDALSRFVYEHSSKLSEDLQDRLFGVVLLLLTDPQPQVFRAALKFAKVIVYVTPRLRLEKLVPKLLKMFDNKLVTGSKMIVRNIVERLYKQLGKETLAGVFPRDHSALLQYVQRQVTRQNRKLKKTDEGEGDAEENWGENQDTNMDGDEPKESWEEFQKGDAEDSAFSTVPAEGTAASKKRKSAEPPTSAVMAHDAVQALLNAWEAESDGSDGEGGNRKGHSRNNGKRKRDGNVASTTVIHEDNDVPIDFMSADAAHSVLTTRPSQAKRRRGGVTGSAGATNRVDMLRRTGLRFAEDGRLVVIEDEDLKENDDESNKKRAFAPGEKRPVKALSKLASLRKSRLEARMKAKTERRGAHQIKGLENFKPGKKGAQGDASRPDAALEPYAYVRLNPKVTKEKHKAKATASFNKVVQGAKKGIVKGLKAKKMDKKHTAAKLARTKRKKQSQKNKRPTNNR